jgi:hypothetical protein
MGMRLSASNLFQFFSTISPILLGFFLLMISLFNLNIKGLVYLGGILIGSFIWILLVNLIKFPAFQDRHATCDLIDWPFNQSAFNSPSYTSYFIAFTFIYLFLPMYYSEEINYGVVIFILILFFSDAITKVNKLCTPPSGPMIGGLLGLFLGFGWFSILHSSGHDDLLYFNEMNSNSVVCKRPEKQTFKCAVYKNGKVIKNL